MSACSTMHRHWLSGVAHFPTFSPPSVPRPCASHPGCFLSSFTLPLAPQEVTVHPLHSAHPAQSATSAASCLAVCKAKTGGVIMRAYGAKEVGKEIIGSCVGVMRAPIPWLLTADLADPACAPVLWVMLPIPPSPLKPKADNTVLSSGSTTFTPNLCNVHARTGQGNCKFCVLAP